LYHHLYSAVCSKPILGAFHYRVFLRESPKSAHNYNVNQMIYGIQECYGSIVIKNGDVFVLVDKDYFRHPLSRLLGGGCALGMGPWFV